ncbi:haloacid dehalogenase [Paraphoma chrysanthemicola]|uniref:Haloacid dehalogenase n=1 Tax=Paraphoma chrysanthemicola TaxID=798071 RepID=A0A8K0VTR9_9PLEO|nr:haloacid dehalogenase [Paraphoma chrysanthemicola]
MLPKVIFFDLMGTCCDWLSSLLPLLHTLPAHPSLAPKDDKFHALALAWREGFFEEIHTRFNAGLEQEDIDVTHRRVLDRLLLDRGIGLDVWDDDVRVKLVQQWHVQVPWPDVLPALTSLRKKSNVFLIVLANGTTRLQLDIASSTQIPFHTLFSSQLLGYTKPDPRIYQRAMGLVGVQPEECVMLASHVYDLKAAKGVGMRTVYVRRESEDVGLVVEEGYGVDVLVDGTGGGVDGGFGEAVRRIWEEE